jgi:PIN domain
MKTNYVLVDYENVPAPTLSLLKGEQFRVWIFLGQNNTKLKKEVVLAMQQLRDRLEIIDMGGSGKNALDFHIAYYLGSLSREDPNGFFHVISEDKGFNPLIEHLRSKHMFAVRSESIEAMPCLQPPKEAITPQSRPNQKELLDLVIAKFRKRKSARPASKKALRSTIHSDCGKDLPDSLIDSVYNAFLKTGYVRTDGPKLQYKGL